MKDQTATMFMVIEGVTGTGADQDEADAIAISGWRWGSNYRAMDKATETDGAWDLSVTRNADRASPLIWQLFLDDRKITTARLYEFSRSGADRVKTLQIDFTTLKVVHYATTRSNTGDLWESFGIRYHEALVGSTHEKRVKAQRASHGSSKSTHSGRTGGKIIFS